MRDVSARNSGHSSDAPRSDADAPLRISHLMWRLSRGGGIPIVVRHLIDSVDPVRIALHIVTVRPRMPEDRLDELAVPVEGLGFTGALGAFDRTLVVVKAAAALRRSRPDVVHVHSGTVWTSVLARLVLPRTPFVFQVHDAPGRGRHSARTEWFEGFLARRFGYRPVCHSTAVQADLEREWRLRSDRITRFPLGITTRQFASPRRPPGQWRAAYDLAPDSPVVLYVARLVASKNVPLLIEAVSRLDGPVTAAVVAEGSQRQELQSEIDRRELGDRVRLLGEIHLPELVDAYNGADVFCSTSDYEGFGLAVVEAMAAGLPVVATAVGGVNDLVVDGETGRLVPRGDAAAVAAALSEVLDNRQRRAAWGQAGRRRATERFDVVQMAEAFTALYEARARP